MSLAISTAFVSLSAGMTERTGSKIPSRAIVEWLSTLPKTVGSMKKPRLSWASAASGVRCAFGLAPIDIALHPVALAAHRERTHLAAGIEWIADLYVLEGCA